MQSAAWAARPARPKNASAATTVRSESARNNHAEPCGAWPAAAAERGELRHARRAAPSWPTSPCHVAGGEIVVRPAQVVPEVVGHLNPHGVAAQADQGQEKLEDQTVAPTAAQTTKTAVMAISSLRTFGTHRYFARRKGILGV